MIFGFLLFHGVFAEIVYFIEVCRHGARSPSDFMEWDEGRWPDGPSALTPEGMRQQYLIGVHLRERYIIENKLLPEEYDSSLLYAVTSTAERAQRSIQCQLHGLYPSNHYDYLIDPSPPIKISEAFDFNNTVNITGFVIHSFLTDPMLHSKDECPEYANYIKIRKKSRGMKKIFEKYEDVVKIVEYTYKVTRDDAEDLTLNVIASIRSNKFHGNSWNPVFNEGFIQKAQELYMETKTYASYSPSFIARFAGSDFFNNIIEQIIQVIEGKMMKKASIYSAHDTTLYNIFATLGMTLIKQPPFASVLLFEVLKENEEFFIRMIYNMKEMIMPGCLSTKCPINIFLDYIQHRVFFNTTEACKLISNLDTSNPSIFEYSVESDQFIVFNSAICMAGILIFSYLIYKKY